MRVLVTGASGFIGGHVAERLLSSASEGVEVRCLVRATSDVARLRSLGAALVVGDLTDAASLARAVSGCDAVVHCGALVSDWATREEIRAINVGGTRSLASATAAAGVARFVYISSTDVYGFPHGSGGPPVDESHVPARFANWYAQTKLEAEAEVRRAAGGASDAAGASGAAVGAGAMTVVVLRPATVYGPRSIEVVGEIATALRGGYMLLVDGGRHVAGLVHVDNVVDAVLLALNVDAAQGETFNVTDGLDVTWRQFTDDLARGLGVRRARLSLPYPVAIRLGVGLEHAYRALRRATGVTLPPLLSRQAVQVLGRDQRFSNRKARERLSWTPRVGYEEGLDATLAWLREDFLTK